MNIGIVDLSQWYGILRIELVAIVIVDKWSRDIGRVLNYSG